MTKNEYELWLQSQQEKANWAVEPSSMLGLAGEMRVLTLEQVDINADAVKLQDLIEEERKIVAEDESTTDFKMRQTKILEKLDAIRDDQDDGA